jgi:hypothetical protein
MTSPTSPIVPCRYCGPDCAIPFGFCHCGCGEKTKLCTQDTPKDNWIKGQPMKYIQHHGKRKLWIPFPVFERPAGILYGCCWCGCGGKAPLAAQTMKSKGLQKGEPQRYIRGHEHRPGVPQYIVKDRGFHLGPCWIWQWAKNRLGYGVISRKGGSRAAHIMVYERHRGPVADGLDLDHLCRFPSCVNPDHLEPVTHAVNMRRGANAKLTQEKADTIRARRACGESRIVLAREFGVSRDTVTHLCSGRTWTN